MKKNNILVQYMFLHIQAFVSSLGAICRTPIASIMTIAVIGIALALPGGLLVLTQNAVELSDKWQSGTQVSLFLHQSVSEAESKQLADYLRKQKDIKQVDYISKEQALSEFNKYSGFGEAIEYLGENPFPITLTVYPAFTLTPENSREFLQVLQDFPEVEMAKVDLEWVQKLHMFLILSKKFVFALATLFAAAVLLIIGNTLRLNIQNEQETIAVTKLLGATDVFVRRPFIYAGSWYGFLGALFGGGIITGTIYWLKDPIASLAALYSSKFHLTSISFAELSLLIIVGVTLGWLAAWLAVTRHIRTLEAN